MNSITDQQTTINNPVQKYWKWKALQGNFEYWDREEKVTVQQDELSFILLNVTYYLTGYSDDHESSLYSNFVKDFTNQELKLRVGKTREVLCEGIYKQIEHDAKAKGASFAQGWYIFNLENSEIQHLEISRAVLGEMISYQQSKGQIKAGDILKLSKTGEQKKKGATIYNVPSFERPSEDGIDLSPAMAAGYIVDQYIAETIDYISSKGSKVESNEIVSEESYPSNEITFEEVDLNID